MIYLAEGKIVRDGKKAIQRLDKLIRYVRGVDMVYLH
jgi:hypothetical protein